MIVNNLYPAHLGESFCRIYKKIYQERLEAKRSGDGIKDSGLKLALNGAQITGSQLVMYRAQYSSNTINESDEFGERLR